MNVFINGNTFDYAGSQRESYCNRERTVPAAQNATITGNTMDIKLDGANNAVNGILAQATVTVLQETALQFARTSAVPARPATPLPTRSAVSCRRRYSCAPAFNGTMRLPGYVGGATDLAAVSAYLNGRNVEVSSSTATAHSTGFAGGAACTQPTITGAITSEATASASSKSDGLTMEASASRQTRSSEDILEANPVEKLEGAPVIGVSQTDVQWIFAAALEKWRQAGISNEDYLKMQAMTFEIAKLPEQSTCLKHLKRYQD